MARLDWLIASMAIVTSCVAPVRATGQVSPSALMERLRLLDARPEIDVTAAFREHIGVGSNVEPVVRWLRADGFDVRLETRRSADYAAEQSVLFATRRVPGPAEMTEWEYRIVAGVRDDRITRIEAYIFLHAP